MTNGSAALLRDVKEIIEDRFDEEQKKQWGMTLREIV